MVTLWKQKYLQAFLAQSCAETYVNYKDDGEKYLWNVYLVLQGLSWKSSKWLWWGRFLRNQCYLFNHDSWLIQMYQCHDSHIYKGQRTQIQKTPKKSHPSELWTLFLEEQLCWAILTSIASKQAGSDEGHSCFHAWPEFLYVQNQQMPGEGSRCLVLEALETLTVWFLGMEPGSSITTPNCF